MDPMGNANNHGGMMPPFMPGMPFPGAAGGEECCIS